MENFWRQLKHDFFHEFLHDFFPPHLDIIVWILINNVTFNYVARPDILQDIYRVGCTNKLSTWQAKFKTAWKKLASHSVIRTLYNVDLATFTCECERQAYNAQHLCKRLVQAVTTQHVIAGAAPFPYAAIFI